MYGLTYANFYKVRNAQQHYFQVSYTKFHLNQTINVNTIDVNSFVFLRKVWLLLSQFAQNSLTLNKGLFKMIVGVLTTCHTQYT